MIEPYVRVEVILTYVDLNRWFKKEKELAHHLFVGTVEEAPILSEQLLKVIRAQDSITVYDSRDDDTESHSGHGDK